MNTNVFYSYTVHKEIFKIEENSFFHLRALSHHQFMQRKAKVSILCSLLECIKISYYNHHIVIIMSLL
jgi:hypothetical protein